eukprot:gene12974-27385_t
MFAGFELSVDPDSELAIAFRSIHYQFSLVTGIAVGFPMLLDYGFDRFGANYLKISKGLIPRRDVMLMLMIPNIIQIAYILPYEKYSYLPCVTKARECFYSYCFFLYATNHCGPIWTKKSVFIPLVTYGISNAIGSLNPADIWGIYDILNLIQGILSITAVLSLCRLYYLYFLYRRQTDKIKPHESYYQNNIYINSTLALGIFFVIIAVSIPHYRWESTGYLYLTLYTYSLCVFATVVTVLNGRIVRIEGFHTK